MSKATAKRVLHDTALQALASLYPEHHRMHSADLVVPELLLRASEEIAELRERVKTDPLVCKKVGAKKIKMSVNLPEKIVEALRSHAAENEITMTEALRRAISLLKWVHQEEQRGSKILVAPKDGPIQEVLF
jgi:hypothetical protein